MESKDSDEITDWAKTALRAFLLRCFASCATTREWEAAALREVAEGMRWASWGYSAWVAATLCRSAAKKRFLRISSNFDGGPIRH